MFSTFFNAALYTFSMSETIENMEILTSVVYNRRGSKSRYSLLVIRVLIFVLIGLLSCYSSNLESLLSFAGAFFCCTISFFVPVRLPADFSIF